MTDQVVIIAITIGIVLLLVMGSSFKPLRVIGRLLVKFVIATILLVVINIVGIKVGLHLPINIVTTSVSAFLGIPGIIALSIIQLYIIK